MGPISTGLGEIYQYTLKVDSAHKGQYSASDLRTMQDWIVSRQMAMVPGVWRINAFGGEIKQYEVAISPDELKAIGLTILIFTTHSKPITKTPVEPTSKKIIMPISFEVKG